MGQGYGVSRVVLVWQGAFTLAMESAVQSAETVVKNTLKTRSEAVLLAFHSRASLSGWGSNLLKVKMRGLCLPSHLSKRKHPDK